MDCLQSTPLARTLATLWAFGCELRLFGGTYGRVRPILLKKSLESWYLLAMLKTRYSREMRDDGTTAW
jgi:hypothetical protein